MDQPCLPGRDLREFLACCKASVTQQPKCLRDMSRPGIYPSTLILVPKASCQPRARKLTIFHSGMRSRPGGYTKAWRLRIIADDSGFGTSPIAIFVGIRTVALDAQTAAIYTIRILATTRKRSGSAPAPSEPYGNIH